MSQKLEMQSTCLWIQHEVSTATCLKTGIIGDKRKLVLELILLEIIAV